MHIHVFQHDNFEDADSIGDWCKAHHHSTSVTRFDQDPVFPEPGSFDWLVIMGGTMGVYEESVHPWLTREKEFIGHAIRDGKVVLGICLGSQLIANVLGAKVYKHSQPEIGFFPVRFNARAQADPVFHVFGEELTVLHVHNDTFDLPAGATVMASSELTPNQAFRFGEHVYALQFHFEVTEKKVSSFVEQAFSEELSGDWIQTAPEILGNAGLCDKNNRILADFLDHISLHYHSSNR